VSRLKELGYTESDFGPSRTFLTARAAETALAAGIVQIRALAPEVELVRDFVNARVSHPDYRFPENIDELSFVFRWGGKGSKWRWNVPSLGWHGWDTQIDKADPDTRFLNAWNISQPALDELRLGGNPVGSATLAEMNPSSAIEITVMDWERPQLTQRFVRGVLFKRNQMREQNAIEHVGSDLYDALTTEGRSRNAIFDEAANLHERPFDDLMPLAAITRGDD
jgi:hypothetical protein